MLTFGHATLIDLLSWVIVLALGVKLAATLVLLPVDKAVWDRPGWGAILWWASKITPMIAAPCALAIAYRQGLTTELWLFSALMLFIVVAVPVKVRQRRTRIVNRIGAAPLA